MIGPKPFPTLQARAADLWRWVTMSASEWEERRVSDIHRQMGGALPLEEVRRIVRAHRL